MTYASAARRPHPAALAGALGLPGAMAALLVVGLAVKVVTTPDEPRLKAGPVTTAPLPPPPPPEPDTPRSARTATNPAIPTGDPVTPALPDDIDLGGPIVDGWPGDPAGTGTGTGTGGGDIGLPQPTPSTSPFDPVGAVPRNNPARWVTDTDYRPRWVRENMTGRATFRLAIDASGKVTGCTVTRSTGHGALDAATCELVTKRARFDAARDGTGRPVAGSYTGAINWQIPE